MDPQPISGQTDVTNGYNSHMKRIAGLTIWGIAFGYMEAAVVVYLRALYYPEGFAFPLKTISQSVLLTEIGREAATLIIMAVTAILAYSRRQQRVAAFFFLFGIWDLFYYLFLKLLLDWPPSLSTWDILFLIPLPWAGPVWAPSLVASAFVLLALPLLMDKHPYRFSRWFLLLETVAAQLIVASFILPGCSGIDRHQPDFFPSPLFWSGFLLGTGTFMAVLYRGKRGEKGE